MDWLNLHASRLDSAEFIGSDTKERGVWLSLLRFCIGQENGGRIADCRAWKDRQWQQVARVTLREVRHECRLYLWDGDDLMVWGYPIEKQEQVQRNRVNGTKGGQAKTEAKTQAAKANGVAGGRPKNPSKNPSENPTEGEGEGEGERKEKGKLGAADEPPPASKPPKQTDDEWLAGLAASPAYEGIDVHREHAKLIAWCSTNSKQPTRRRFINWLNRCERPMKATGTKGEFADAW